MESYLCVLNGLLLSTQWIIFPWVSHLLKSRGRERRWEGSEYLQGSGVLTAWQEPPTIHCLPAKPWICPQLLPFFFFLKSGTKRELFPACRQWIFAKESKWMNEWMISFVFPWEEVCSMLEHMPRAGCRRSRFQPCHCCRSNCRNTHLPGMAGTEWGHVSPLAQVWWFFVSNTGSF